MASLTVSGSSLDYADYVVYDGVFVIGELPTTINLENDQVTLELTMGNTEDLPLKNENLLPPQISFGGYVLEHFPADITEIEFVESLAAIDSSGEKKQIYLNMLIDSESGGGLVNLLIGNNKPLIPIKDFHDNIPLALPRGQTRSGSEWPQVNLSFLGKYTNSFLCDRITRNFDGVICLRFDFLDYAEFKDS